MQLFLLLHLVYASQTLKSCPCTSKYVLVMVPTLICREIVRLHKYSPFCQACSPFFASACHCFKTIPQNTENTSSEGRDAACIEERCTVRSRFTFCVQRTKQLIQVTARETAHRRIQLTCKACTTTSIVAVRRVFYGRRCEQNVVRCASRLLQSAFLTLLDLMSKFRSGSKIAPTYLKSLEFIHK